VGSNATSDSALARVRPYEVTELRFLRRMKKTITPMSTMKGVASIRKLNATVSIDVDLAVLLSNSLLITSLFVTVVALTVSYLELGLPLYENVET